MTVEKEFKDNSRTTEALLATGELIQEAILTYAPTPKASRPSRVFSPLIKRNRLPIGRGANHTFSGRPGKFADTPANRELIEGIANGGGRSLGKDRYGKEWFVKTLDNGRQVYVYTKDGVIKGAGFNSPPRPLGNIIPK